MHIALLLCGGLRGDTPLERAKATMVCEGVHDVLDKSYPIFEEKDEAKKVISTVVLFGGGRG